MRKRTVFFAVIALVSLIMLTVITLPLPVEIANIPFDLNDGTSGTVVFTIPRYLRLGDRAKVTMEVNLDQSNNNSPEKSVKLKARLEAIQLDVNPFGTVSAVIQATGKAAFSWIIQSGDVANKTGNTWLFNEGGENQSDLILAREITLETKAIFGMQYKLMRWGLLGIILICAGLAARSLLSANKNRYDKL